MRWFKHMTLTRSDERVAAYISECGMEGYGFFWMVLETVALVMDKTGKCEVYYPLNYWVTHGQLHRTKVTRLLNVLKKHGLLMVEFSKEGIWVKIPNLLKYRDEYTQRSGQTPDKLPTKYRDTIGTLSGQTPVQETEAETEAEREEEKKEKNKKEKRIFFEEEDTYPDPGQVVEIFEHWQKTMDAKKSKLDEKRVRLIEGALVMGYAVGDLKDAITGCSLSPWNMGDNPEGIKNNSIDLIFRNADKIDKFISFFKDPPKKKLTIEQQNEITLKKIQRDREEGLEDVSSGTW